MGEGDGLQYDDGPHFMPTEQYTSQNPLVTPHYSQQDFQDLEQLRFELIAENNRIREQEARLKRQFERYQHDLTKLQRDKAEVKRQREANKEEAYRIT